LSIFKHIKDTAFVDANTSDQDEAYTFGDVGNAFLSKAKGDRFIWGLVILLSLVSVLVVYSATGSLAYKKYHGNTEFFLFKQLAFMMVGLLLIYFLHQINYNIFSKIASLLFYISIPLLIYTLFFGTTINDGSRWIKLPIINTTIQTSDLARLALFMYLSKILSKKQDVIKSFKQGFLPAIIPVIVICGLIMPANLSNALLTGGTSLLLLFIGRVSFKHILLTVGIALIPIALIISIAVATHNDAKAETSKPSIGDKAKQYGRLGTWVKRVQDFIYAKQDETPYQVQQAKIAIANGSLFFGLGPGNSLASNYLPQAYNDFIFAIIIEEYGLLGAMCIMFIYILFLFRCIKIFKNCPYAFGAFLSIALSFTLIIQAIANMAVSVSLVPVTGVTLPLVSMGGSSFLFTCASIGIILSVGRNVEQIANPTPREGVTTT
jgi:cell division protein FtsW